MEIKINKKPLFGIIGGNGKMGNWFKIFFERNNLPVIISDLKTELSNIEIAKRADIIIVSVPIQKFSVVIKEIKPFLKNDSLLTDITSLKTQPIKEMSKCCCGVLGMHPLFGPLAPDLKNQNIVFCYQKNNHWVDFLKKLFQKNNANVIEISAKEHDRQMAFTQALLYFINLNYAHIFADKKFKLLSNFLTPAFKLQSLVLGRILGQDSHLYASLEMENPYFCRLLESYEQEVGRLKKIVKLKDYRNFEKQFNRSADVFSDFIKVAQKKSVEVLKILEKQQVKIGKLKKIKISENKIGFLGPEGTFSWEAGRKIFLKNNLLVPFENISDIFMAITEEKINLAVAPIENCIAGLVSETINCFIDFPVFAIGSFKMPIHHFLASKENSLKKIKVIKSHPQPIIQCSYWLKENIPWAIQESASSTVAPLKECLENVGFIVPYYVAKKHKLNILGKRIENIKDNFTKFLVITNQINNEIIKNFQSKNTLLLLSIYDRPGILRDILSVFADKNINLSAIHSIPSYALAWDYFFFLEVEKQYFSKEIKECLKELEKYCPYIKPIGVA
ncbi:MAG: prephenate dehydrogenase/arogenate dehydrogenase family protein [Patescibacteria group bacterium]